MAEHPSTDSTLLLAVLRRHSYALGYGLGVFKLLIHWVVNSLLWGLVSQQFYAYWTTGFEDPIFLKVFVVVQFLLISFQCVLSWHFAFHVFVPSNSVLSGPPRSQSWEGPLNSMFQIFIILLANIFLAVRIHCLTKSVIQTGTVIVLSLVAFTSGWINIITWELILTPYPYNQSSSLIWHVTQAAAQCLISYFLSRVFLKSGSGVHRSDSILDYLVRAAIQTSILATVWAVAALVAFFFLPKVTVYKIFDITSGAVYVRAVFNTLLVRVQPRKCMASATHRNLDLPSPLTAIQRVPGSINVSKVASKALDRDNPDSGPSFPIRTYDCGVVLEEEE
ncbi:hypothetical protein BC827DRAFT_1201802 [Russula dissimulans]|nr:hypothetical protein BC827DRAFT_1201802 [Russula dissimulans]